VADASPKTEPMIRSLAAVTVAFALLAASAAHAATTKAVLSVSPNPATAGQTVILDGSKSRCARAPCHYAWFDNGTWIAGTQNATSTFTAGRHTVGLVVFDGSVSRSATVMLTVNGAPPPPPPPPSGYTPTITNVIAGTNVSTPASNTEYRDCTSDWITLPDGVHDVQFTNCNMGGLGGSMAGASRIVFEGGDFGPEGCSGSNAVHPTIAGVGWPAPSYITFDHVLFHDMLRSSACSSAHTEGLQIGSGMHLRITDNTFRHNSIMDLFARAWDDRGIQDVTIQGNYFGALATDDGTSVGFSAVKITGNDPGRLVSGFHLLDNTCEAQGINLADAGSAVVENAGNLGC
jgi:hypothetical protein